MSKKWIALIVLIILLAGGFITYYYLTNKDAITFKKEFESYNDKSFKSEGKNTKYVNVKLNTKNPIIYVKDEDILNTLQDEGKMILFGNADDNNTREAIPTLFEAAKDNGIEEIYYYPMKDLEKKYEKGDKKAEKIYEGLTEALNSHLTETFKNGNKKDKKKITVPTVIVVNKGKIVSYQSGIEEKQALYKTYENVMLDLIMCTDDC